MGKPIEELNNDAAASRLVERCSGNPAQLRSVAALCRKKGTEATLDYLEKCQQKMRHAKLPDAEGYGTLFDALAGTLQFLAQENAGLSERCAMLAVFPEDSQVPLAVVGQLWGLDELETEEAVDELASWHLVEVEGGEGSGHTLSLIDLHLDYLRASAKEDLVRWHAALLRGCGQRVLGHWEEGREDDAYWGRNGWANVLHHLRGCGWEAGALGGEVTVLYLGRAGVDDEDAKGLAGMVASSGSLVKLYLHGNNIGDEGAKAIAAGVAASGSLATLLLGSNKIGDEGAKAIAEALVSSGSLVKLGLHSNSIGDEGAKAIAAGVAASGSLATLDLGHNKIGDEGAKALAEALPSSGSLATLLLGYNKIGVEGAKALAEALLSSGSLATLGLNNNKIGDVGAKALAEALVSSGSMATLNLRNNNIGDVGAKALAEALVPSGSMSTLYLNGNSNVGDAAKQSLWDAVQGRQGFQLQV